MELMEYLQDSGRLFLVGVMCSHRCWHPRYVFFREADLTNIKRVAPIFEGAEAGACVPGIVDYAGTRLNGARKVAWLR